MQRLEGIRSLDRLQELDAKLSKLNLLLKTGIQAWAREVHAAGQESLSGAERKRIRERANWNEIKANQGYRAELLRVLDELCTLYLDARPTQRDTIRSMVADKHEVLSALNGYMYRALDRYQATADTKWLYIGLASIAIEELRIDYRDTLVALGAFFVTAVASGVDPRPLMAEVANLASADVTALGTSTKAFLSNFEATAYFESSVKPKVGRIDSGKS
jgi:hypothetical protein